MMGPATVELELRSAPQSVALIRAGLKGLGTLLKFDPELLDDLQMAASEACNNVVRHAYRGDQGPLHFSVTASQAGVEVVVRDSGEWIDAESPGDEQTGLGLALIDALADRTEITQLPEGGTEICMRFSRAVPGLQDIAGARHSQGSATTPREAPAAVPGEAPAHGPREASAARTQHQHNSLSLGGDVIATVSPVALLPGVLGRLARALAANARFSVERFADIHVLVDSLVAHAQRWASDRRISCALASEVRRLSFRLAPLRQGASELAGTDCDDALRLRLSRIVDELEFEPRGDSEVLSLTFTERGLAHAI